MKLLSTTHSIVAKPFFFFWQTSCTAGLHAHIMLTSLILSNIQKALLRKKHNNLTIHNSSVVSSPVEDEDHTVTLYNYPPIGRWIVVGGFVYNKYSLNQLDESEKVFFSFGIFKKRHLGRALLTVKLTVLTNTKGDFVKCISMILLQIQ